MSIKHILRILGIEIVFFVLSITFVLSNTFNLGYGLGNIFFLIIPLAASIIFTVLGFTVGSIKNKKTSRIIALVSLIASTVLCFYIIYAVTLGRGPECAWNGIVFNPC